ncbi:MAG: DNA translocase FtsK [Spirochaetaceae bacterium]|jgi:S-DNA-T family DNA segregation ATPase FtsK/SpoIIIE|nr:DNA translocase FtsK [Spirochaetaceae bacterium]
MSSFRGVSQDINQSPKKKLKKRKLTCWTLGFCFFAAAVLIGLSISGALFGFPPGGNFLGELLAGSYGAVAFAIPAYLIFAALILFDKVFRPARIFILNCIIFPFITLSIGFSYLRDFDFFAAKAPFLQFFGKNGFGFLMIFLTVMECAAIAAFSNWFFPPIIGRKIQRQQKPSPEESDEKQEGGEVRIIRVPIRRETDAQPAAASAVAVPPQTSAIVVEDRKNAVVYDGEPLFKEVKSGEDHYNLNVGRGKAALDEAFERARAEVNMRTLDEAFENLNEKLKIFDEIKSKYESPPPPSIANANANEEIVLEEDEVFSSIGEEAFEDCDLEKLIMMAESEAAQKTEEFIQKGRPNVENEVAEDSAQTAEILSKNAFHPVLTEAGEPDAGLSALPEAEAGGAVVKKNFDEKAPEIEAEAGGADEKKNILPPPPCYKLPVDGLLKDYEGKEYWIIDDETKRAASVLKATLNEFNIEAEVTGIRKGPVITMFEILPSPGVKLSKIVNLQDNIALRLAASSVRIVAPIPGKHAVGIEIPNKERSLVSFKELIKAQMEKVEGERKKWALPIALGKSITGDAVTVDLAAMPHLLIAGSTGSGKSVCVNTMILSILYQCTPRQCRLILIDPKIVELKLYNDVPHLLTPVITEPKRAFQALQYCICEMERRYACLDGVGVRDIKTYNKRIKERNIAAEHMPYIVIVIDEFADLMATTGKELESTVARLAAMSRAVGIHIVLATQRPSIDVITGLIKSNIPSRIAFMVASMMDSRIIIDSIGAEKLLGKGDMLYSGVSDPFPVRMQGAFVSEEEVERVVEHVKTLGEPDYIDEEIFIDEEDESAARVYNEDGADPLYDRALELVVQQGKASASYIQRRLKVGYNRAARLVEEMESRGVVGPAQGSRPRDILRAL